MEWDCREFRVLYGLTDFAPNGEEEVEEVAYIRSLRSVVLLFLRLEAEVPEVRSAMTHRIRVMTAGLAEILEVILPAEVGPEGLEARQADTVRQERPMPSIRNGTEAKAEAEAEAKQAELQAETAERAEFREAEAEAVQLR
jgi:hypothetical protein